MTQPCPSRCVAVRAGAATLATLTAAAMTPLSLPAAVALPLGTPMTTRAAAGSVDTGPVTVRKGGRSLAVSQGGGLTNQNVTVSWTGMAPSDGDVAYVSNNPVVLMQCRGVEHPGPGQEKLRRETCWNPFPAPTWLPLMAGLDEPDIVTHAKQGVAATKGAEGDPPGLQFVAADGKVGVPEDLAGPTETRRQGFTRADGRGDTVFKLLTKEEAPSLGCSEKVACSIVAVPIGPNPGSKTWECAQPYVDLGFVGEYGRRVKDIVCGPTNSEGVRTDFKEPTNGDWAAPEIWNQRLSVPLQFLPAAMTCKQDGRASTSVFGSEIMSSQMRQTVPVFCLDPKRFNLAFTAGSETEGRDLLTQPYPLADSGFRQDAAFVSRPLTPEQRRLRTVEYAPAAISGFAVTFTLDDADGRPVHDLKITPRILAKLLTQSYRASFEAHPAIGKNPASPLSDPDFLAANPGKTFNTDSFTFGFPVWADKKTDVMAAVTAYISSDKDALAFLAGKPDRWGMKINPLYKGWAGIHDNLQLRDRFSEKVSKAESARGSVPLLSQVANPADSWDTAARDVLNAAPEALDWDTEFKRFKRRPVQELGMRALIGIAPIGDARRRGLDVAALKNAKGRFVLPGRESLAAGASATTTDSATGVATPAPARMPRAAYPGTMITYQASATYGLKPDAAKRIAELIEYDSRAGRGFGAAPGQIADGYADLTPALRKRAQAVASMVRAQKGAKPAGPSTTGTTSGNTGGDPASGPGSSGHSDSGAPVAGDTSAAAPAAAAPAPSGTPSTTAPTSAPASAAPASSGAVTQAASGPLGTTQGGMLGTMRWALPALLVAALLAGLSAPIARQAGTPGSPVRRWSAASRARLESLRRGRR